MFHYWFCGVYNKPDAPQFAKEVQCDESITTSVCLDPRLKQVYQKTFCCNSEDLGGWQDCTACDKFIVPCVAFPEEGCKEYDKYCEWKNNTCYNRINAPIVGEEVSCSLLDAKKDKEKIYNICGYESKPIYSPVDSP